MVLSKVYILTKISVMTEIRYRVCCIGCVLAFQPSIVPSRLVITNLRGERKPTRLMESPCHSYIGGATAPPDMQLQSGELSRLF